MEQIIRSTGVTESERYLAKLADRTFLNLWAYPNVYRDDLVNGHRVGREICDLLVVCGEHILIFSDKDVGWSANQDVNIAWSRWYKRAVQKGVSQLHGAENWIIRNPQRIFLDEPCTRVLPIELPQSGQRTIHKILVTHGAAEACARFFNGDSGSFMLLPDLQGDAHLDTSAENYSPFTVGDIDPLGSFIHVLNDVTLDIVMRELDTVTDFVTYLSEKARFVRSGNLILAAGEEDLLAYYLTHMGSKDRHGFPHPQHRPWASSDRLSLSTGHYEGMVRNPQYVKKKEADKQSYLWDHLIKTFTDNMLAGTTIIPDSRQFEIDKHALGVQYMAQEPRIMRRMLSERIRDILERSHLQDRTFGGALPTAEYPGNGTGYIFLTLAHPKRKLEGGYEQYRQARANMLQGYCLGTLKQFPSLKRVVGIATEPPPVAGAPSGSSEDMAFAVQPSVWTSELESELDRLRKHYDILKEDRITFRHMGVQEYPD